MKKILVLTGGGDCPGLNAVIRAIAKSGKQSGKYEIWGSMEALNGVMNDPPDIVRLSKRRTAGIHVKGGTIIRTTNKGNPMNYPIQLEDGTWTTKDITDDIVKRVRDLGFYALINIGGDGSQKISQVLYDKGVNVVGVPKTIDNDLSATDRTFGFATAVQIATDAFDKLVTTAESHHRVMILEVMGRDAGWIALYTAIAGGAEICLIPEIPYDIEKVVKRVNKRYKKGRGFANIVIAEGATRIGGGKTFITPEDMGDSHVKLGGVANVLRYELEKAGCLGQVRSTILGHLQRGGTPIAFDRILATAMGVKAFEMVDEGVFGQMVSYRGSELTSVAIADAVKEYNYVSQDHFLIHTARKMGISFGD
jgi:6-phosphofructokinase 1